MKKLDKAYVVAEITSIADRDNKHGYTKDVTIDKIADFVVGYADKLTDPLKKQIQVNEETQKDLLDRLSNKEQELLALQAQRNEEAAQVELAIESNQKMLEAITTKEKQIAGLINCVTSLVDKLD